MLIYNFVWNHWMLETIVQIAYWNQKSPTQGRGF
jgi:hypothetical protein